MPNVIMEAMASGLPCVTTNVEGVGELLAVNADQQTVAFGDSDAFIARVKRFLADKEYGRAIARANQQRAAEQFTRDAMVDQYQQLYQSLIEKKRD